MTKAEMEEWLPKLVGVERSVELLVGESATAGVGRCIVDEDRAPQLARKGITGSVRYVRFSLSPGEIERFASEPVVLAINHPGYAEGVRLSDDTKATLLEDLRGA